MPHHIIVCPGRDVRKVSARELLGRCRADYLDSLDTGAVEELLNLGTKVLQEFLLGLLADIG